MKGLKMQLGFTSHTTSLYGLRMRRWFNESAISQLCAHDLQASAGSWHFKAQIRTPPPGLPQQSSGTKEEGSKGGCTVLPPPLIQ